MVNVDISVTSPWTKQWTVSQLDLNQSSLTGRQQHGSNLRTAGRCPIPVILVHVTRLDFALTKDRWEALKKSDLKMPHKSKKSKPRVTCKNILLLAREKPDQIHDLLPDINQIFPDGRTLLTFAIENNEGFNLIESIVKSGADVNVQNQQGQTALMIAARAQRNDVLRLLIQSGAKLDVLNYKQMTALAICITNNNNIGVDLLILTGADVHIKTGTYKETALELAARLGHGNLKEVFMKFEPGGGESDQCKTSHLNTESDQCKTSHLNTEKDQCKSSNPDTTNVIHNLQKKEVEEIRNMFSRVSRAPNVRITIGLKTFQPLANKLYSMGAINFQDEHGITVLMYAAMQSPSKALEYILKFNPDVNKQDIDGKTALMYAFSSKQHLKVSTVYRLMGHRPYVQDKLGKTALMYAIDNRFELPPETVKLLMGDTTLIYDKVRNGFLYCDLSLKQLLNESAVISDNEGRTHLMYALERQPNLSLEEVKALLGDTLNCQDKQGRTALIYALIHIPYITADLVSILKGKNINMSCLMLALANRDDLSEVILKCVLGDQNNVRDGLGLTPLMHAVTDIKFERFIKLILKWGADLNIQDHKGKTVFMHAIVQAYDRRDRLDYISIFESRRENATTRNNLSEETLIGLLGKEINLTDEQGWTALTYAVKYFQSNNLIQHILKSGADVNIKHVSGHTVLMTILEGSKSRNSLSELVFFFNMYRSNQNHATREQILDSLQYLQNPMLSEENKVYLSKYLQSHSSINFNWACTNNKRLLVWFLINSIFLDLINVRNSKFQDTSPLLVALELNQLDVAKYLIANFYLTGRDLVFLSQYYKTPMAENHVTGFMFISLTLERYRLKISQENTEYVKRLTSSPWPLVKLALITVSSAIGFHEKRQSYVSKLPIPQIMRNYLVFQSPEAKTPVDQWSKISLC
ncbi:hypothetical protein Btru_044314 [Bulinus truncatus]|nr:hypothetical protein Btru_044314 [Bulinus truncatus]